MALSLFARFLGFNAFPWMAVTLFGSGIQTLNERAIAHLFGNAFILVDFYV